MRPGRPPFSSGPFLRGPRRSVGAMMEPAPDVPSSPSPTDAATAYYTLLSWVSKRATKFDIYLDTVNPPTTIVAPKYASASYVPTLTPSTTYYWKIVAFNGSGLSTAGPVWSFTTPAATAVLFELDGTIVTARAQRQGLHIQDVLGPEPNHAALTFNTAAPTSGALIRSGLGTLDDEKLLFGGEVQTFDQQYEGAANLSLVYPATLIDHTFRLNRRRPFGTWVNTSASTIARYYVGSIAPGFSANHVQDNLPAVSITFDGSQDFMTCMRALATAISDSTNAGKTKVDYAQDVWLYLTYTGEQPDPIDTSHPPLNAPSPIRFTDDLSQIRTRVYGKGHGETLLADVAAYDSILPIADAVMFNALGGKAIASTTSDGAQSEILAYTGVQLGGSGSLVGPGAAPSVKPGLALLTGTELGTGVYQYAYTDVTASGESLPSPIGTITTGVLAAPASAPTAGTPTTGGSVNAGVHDYQLTFVTSAGETTPSPISNAVTVGGDVVTGTVTPPASAPTNSHTNNPNAQALGSWNVGDSVAVAVTYHNAQGETTPGPLSNAITIADIHSYGNPGFAPEGVLLNGIPVSSDSSVTSYSTNYQKRIYFKVNGTYQGYDRWSNNITDTEDGIAFRDQTSPPSSNTATILAPSTAVPLTGIPLGDANVTSRKLYRRFNATGTFKLVATLNTTDTAFTDTIANASLGAAAPSSNTATVRRVAVSGIAVGASPTTSRKVYRTVVGGSQLKLLTTLADNTTTTFADSTVDGSLGANAPTSDTSGITQPTGQVLAGATSFPTASAGPFSTSGGWATVGGQAFRYSGISVNTLTGIPASGAGAIVTTVSYGSQVLPAPALTGVSKSNGPSLALAKGSKVNIWVQRDDLVAQAALGVLERDRNGNPTDGIREYTISDERSTEDRIIDLCDAQLAIFSRPIVSATYYTRDTKTKSGRTASISLPIFAVGSTSFYPQVFDPTVFDGAVFMTADSAPFPVYVDFTIQSVAITVDAVNENPLYFVTASSVQFTLNDLLRTVALKS